MASKRWTLLPGLRLKRWRKSRTDRRPGYGRESVPPHWYRNALNRRERRQSAHAVQHGEGRAAPFIHPRSAGWYW
jgi:hypothetical protein